MNERTPKASTPVDGIIVKMTWYCGICKHTWQQYIDQGTIRRMPSHVTVRGRRIETRRPDGSMMRAHEECAQRMLRWMEQKELLKKPKEK